MCWDVFKMVCCRFFVSGKEFPNEFLNLRPSNFATLKVCLWGPLFTQIVLKKLKLVSYGTGNQTLDVIFFSHIHTLSGASAADDLWKHDKTSNFSFWQNVFNSITYLWSLGKQTSTRLGNVHCPTALHHDRCAAIVDRTQDPIQSPGRKPLVHCGFLNKHIN